MSDPVSSSSGASVGARNANTNNTRRNGRRNTQHAPHTTVFEGSDPALKGYIYDVPNMTTDPEQFHKTTKQMAIVMASEMGFFASELSTAFVTLKLAEPTAVEAPEDPEDMMSVHKWKSDYKDHKDMTKAYTTFKAKLFLKVQGQCTPAMIGSMTRHTKYTTVETARDGFNLLVIIEEISMGLESRSNTAVAVTKAQAQYVKTRQGNKSLFEYHELYKNRVATLQRIGGCLIAPGVAKEIAMFHGRDVPNDEDNTEASDKCIAVSFITNSSYPKYVNELHNALLDGNDNYPNTLEEAYEIMHLRGPEMTRTHHQEGVAFATVGAQNGTVVPGRNGRSFPNIKCHGCEAMGHYSEQCPAGEGENNRGATQIGFSFSQVENKAHAFTIPKTWILLDSQSTVDVFHNKAMLRDVQAVGHRMYIHCNAGTVWTDQQGVLPGYGRVWYCPKAIANILSLHNVSRRYRVTYNSREGNEFVVLRDDGVVANVFKMSDSGLFYYDVSAVKDEDAAVLVNTVSDNKTRYTRAETTKAEYARALQRILGHVSKKDYIHIVTHNLLPNCPVTKRDIEAAEDIFGPDLLDH